MKQEELTKTFMMFSSGEKLFGLHGLYESISKLQGSMTQGHIQTAQA